MNNENENEGISSEEAFKEDALAFMEEQRAECFLGFPDMAKILVEIISQKYKEEDEEWKEQCLEALRKVAYEESSEFQKAKEDFHQKFSKLLGDTMSNGKLNDLEILLIINECLHDESFHIDPAY